MRSIKPIDDQELANQQSEIAELMQSALARLDEIGEQLAACYLSMALGSLQSPKPTHRAKQSG